MMEIEVFALRKGSPVTPNFTDAEIAKAKKLGGGKGAAVMQIQEGIVEFEDREVRLLETNQTAYAVWTNYRKGLVK